MAPRLRGSTSLEWSCEMKPCEVVLGGGETGSLEDGDGHAMEMEPTPRSVSVSI